MKSGKTIPPKLAQRLLLSFLREDLAEEVQGDLEEKFYITWKEKSPIKAKLNYCYEVLNYLRPFATRKLALSNNTSIHPDMIRNYIKIAFRNLKRQKVYSTLNILGLALGLACVFLITMHIHDELSYESFIPNHKRIYRLSLEEWAKSAPPMARYAEEFIPEIQQTARFYHESPKIFRYGDFQAREEHGYLADSSVFSMFNFEFIHGDPNHAFQAPNSMVITEGTARKYFGHDNPVGKSIKADEQEFAITGVMKDLPDNTHFRIDYLVSIGELSERTVNSIGWMSTYTYVLFNDPEDVKEARKRLPDLLVEYYKEWGPPEEILKEINWRFMPLDDIHLHSRLTQEMGTNGNIMYVYIFAVIAVFILIIAAINFINIFTTQSIKRMKEVGIRRTVGAAKNQVLWQFLSEAFTVTLLASVLALLLFELALPFYNDLSGKEISQGQLFNYQNIVTIVGIVIAIGLLSGLYPTFFVSGFSPLRAMAGTKKQTSSAGVLRKGLLVFQFAAAVFMIISTAIVYLQMQYFHHKNLGFDKDQVVAVNLFGELKEKFVQNTESLQSALMEDPDIIDVGASSNLPGHDLSVEMVIPDNTPEDHQLPSVKLLRVDENYLSALHINIKEGRNFSREFNDSASFIMNEAAVRALGLENPIGGYVTNGVSNVRGPVIGVIDNYNFSSLRNPVEPLVLQYKPQWTGFLLIKIRGGKIKQTLASLEETIHKIVPDYLFTYQFLDDRIDLLYQDEARMNVLFRFFAIFSIIIACLGLFGLSAHAAEIRTKEIAIRKTIGATMAQLVKLLSGEFMVLVIIGNILAWPLAWWAMRQWLETFAYHVSIHWAVFVAASLLSILVAFFTVSYHAIRTATANPVEALKSE